MNNRDFSRAGLDAGPVAMACFASKGPGPNPGQVYR